jgi:hypothetical protein
MFKFIKEEIMMLIAVIVGIILVGYVVGCIGAYWLFNS